MASHVLTLTLIYALLNSYTYGQESNTTSTSTNSSNSNSPNTTLTTVINNSSTTTDNNGRISKSSKAVISSIVILILLVIVIAGVILFFVLRGSPKSNDNKPKPTAKTGLKKPIPESDDGSKPFRALDSDGYGGNSNFSNQPLTINDKTTSDPIPGVNSLL